MVPTKTFKEQYVGSIWVICVRLLSRLIELVACVYGRIGSRSLWRRARTAQVASWLSRLME